MVTTAQAERYYRRKKRIPNIVYSQIQPSEVIYGGRAVNKQLPRFLQMPTLDFDIFSRSPRKQAKRTEKVLDKKFGGNYFEVKPAQHRGTFRVKSRVSGEVYADYSKLRKKIPSKKINGKLYVPLSFVKKHIKQTLKSKSAKFRHERDRATLRRIEIFERMRKRKK